MGADGAQQRQSALARDGRAWPMDGAGAPHCGLQAQCRYVRLSLRSSIAIIAYEEDIEEKMADLYVTIG